MIFPQEITQFFLTLQGGGFTPKTPLTYDVVREGVREYNAPLPLFLRITKWGF